MGDKRTISLKILSDGSPRGTKVVDVETGKTIRHISGIKIDFPQSGAWAPVARLELHFTPIDLELEGLVEGSCPFCRQRFLVDEVFARKPIASNLLVALEEAVIALAHLGVSDDGKHQYSDVLMAAREAIAQAEEVKG